MRVDPARHLAVESGVVSRPEFVMEMQMHFMAVGPYQRPYRFARQSLLSFAAPAERDAVARRALTRDLAREVEVIGDEDAIEQTEPLGIGRMPRHRRHSLNRACARFVDAKRPWLEMVGMEVADDLDIAALQQIGEALDCHNRRPIPTCIRGYCPLTDNAKASSVF